MSEYKKGLLGKYGVKTVQFCFDDLDLKDGEKLPEGLAGETIFIRKMSGAQFEQFASEHAMLKDDDGAITNKTFLGVRGKMVALCMADPEGNLVFESGEDATEHLNNEFLGAAFVACQQVNGIGSKAAEAAEKNS